MTTLIREVYEALKEAGASEEKSVAAAEALSEYREIKAILPHLATKADLGDLRAELEKVKGTVNTLRWMIGFNLALTAAVLFKLLL